MSIFTNPLATKSRTSVSTESKFKLSETAYLYRIEAGGDSFIRYFDAEIKKDLLLFTIKITSIVLNNKQISLTEVLAPQIYEFTGTDLTKVL